MEMNMLEVFHEYKLIGTNKDRIRGKSGDDFIINSDMECQRIICDREDNCFLNIGAHAI